LVGIDLKGFFVIGNAKVAAEFLRVVLALAV
jgi:hypothetical protein